MTLINDIDFLLESVEKQEKRRKTNQELYEIYQGNLEHEVREIMRKTLSPDTFVVASERIAPINVLRKVVDKLSTIYQQNPTRVTVNGSESDDELKRFYEENFKINQTMNVANEFYNMSKTSAIMPFIHMGKPRLRAIPANKFMVASTDAVDPTYVTHFMTIQGNTKDKYGNSCMKLNVWTDNEFLIINSKGEVLWDEMNAINNPDGINPYGKIPAVYINRSIDLLVPTVDSDMLRMTTLVPLILTDLNVGAMFTVWPIMYTTDVNIKDLAYSPKTTIQMFTDPTTNNTPSIGTIEPKMDIAGQLNLLTSQISFWLSTKNIRPGSVGDLTADNFASGVSKMIDEGDTLEERKRQVETFKVVEQQLWDLVVNYMHRVWVQSGQMEQQQLFTPGVSIDTEFPIQLPMSSRGQLVGDMKTEYDAGFISKKMAIKKLNPEYSDAQIEDLLFEIEEEKNQSNFVDLSSNGVQNGMAESQN